MRKSSLNTKRNYLTKKKNCGKEQHSPNFPEKVKMGQKVSNVRPVLLPFRSWHNWDSNQIKLTVQWQTGGEISEKLKEKKRIAHSVQTQWGDWGKVTVSYTSSVFTRQRREPQTLPVNRQHWHRPEPHLSPYSHTCAQESPTSEKRLISAFFRALLSPLMNNFCFSANQCYTWHSTALKEKHNKYDPIERSSEAPAQQRAAHKSFLPCLMQFELSSVLCSVMPGGDTVEVGS